MVLSLSGPHISHLTLGHFLLHIATAVLVVLPVYLAVNAYARTGSRRFLLLTAAFVALAARETTLSYFMISGTTATVGDTPVDHLFGLVALVLLTAAFLVKSNNSFKTVLTCKHDCCRSG